MAKALVNETIEAWFIGKGTVFESENIDVKRDNKNKSEWESF